MPRFEKVAVARKDGYVARVTLRDLVDEDWLADMAGYDISYEMTPVPTTHNPAWPVDDPLRDLIEAATKRALRL